MAGRPRLSANAALNRTQGSGIPTHMPYRNKNLTPEIRSKIRQFYRILISYGDFKQAHYIATYILDEKLHDSEDMRLLEALNCAMIISYCRPFSGNDRNTDRKIPDLSASFLSGLSEDEKEIHAVVMADRKTLIAHSDSSAHDLRPEVWKIKGHKILMPWKNNTRAPLAKEATITFQSLAQKMLHKVIIEHKYREPEMLQYFTEIDPTIDNTANG